MSWIDTMRLRRRATAVRALGWTNLALALMASVVDFDAVPALITWAAGVMVLSYALGHGIDKQAERIIGR